MLQSYWEDLQKAYDFSSMDTMRIVAQIIGLLAMVLMIASYQARRRGILFMQMASSALWVVHFFMLGSVPAACLNALVIPRNLLYAQKERWAFVRHIAFPCCTATVFLTAGCLTYTKPVDILPMAAMVISSFALYLNRENLLRACSLSVSLLWMVYDAQAGSIPGALCELITILSIFVALARHRKDAI